MCFCATQPALIRAYASQWKIFIVFVPSSSATLSAVQSLTHRLKLHDDKYANDRLDSLRITELPARDIFVKSHEKKYQQ